MLSIDKVPATGTALSIITTTSFDSKLLFPESTPTQLFAAIETLTSPSTIASTSKLKFVPSKSLKFVTVALVKKKSSWVKPDTCSPKFTSTVKPSSEVA